MALGDLDDYKEKNAEIEKERKRIADRDRADVKKILDLPEGRRQIWRWLGEAGVFRASFTPNANQTAFHEGQRDRGLALLTEVNAADPNAFAKMQREAVSEAKSKPKEN